MFERCQHQTKDSMLHYFDQIWMTTDFISRSNEDKMCLNLIDTIKGNTLSDIWLIDTVTVWSNRTHKHIMLNYERNTLCCCSQLSGYQRIFTLLAAISSNSLLLVHYQHNYIKIEDLYKYKYSTNCL